MIMLTSNASCRPAPRIDLVDVDVQFPVFTPQGRGLLNRVLMSSLGVGRSMPQFGEPVTRVVALTDISISIRSDDKVGLIGLNGAGKTTLLRVISRAIEPQYGTVDVNGTVSSLTDLLLGVDPEADGREFIITRCHVMGVAPANIPAIYADVLAFTELNDFISLPIRTYSAGMLLRLAFAVATAIEAEILLMDEMIGAGDVAFIEKAQRRLNGILHKSRILVLASHNEAILQQFCNRGIILNRGRVVFDGSISEALGEYHRLAGT